MPIFRFKGEVLLILGVVVLLATGVSNVPIPSAQASTQANTQALQTLVKKNDPVAIVFHLCKFIPPKPPTGKASCHQMWGNYYYVHNGMALANLTENEPGAEVGHVAVWKTPVKWYICSQAHIEDSANPQECKHGCPSIKPPSGCQDDKAYWVRDRTLGEYDSSVKINNQPITVKKVPIAFKVGNETHNGVFVCYIPEGSTDCDTKISQAISQAFSGRLYYEHYVRKGAAQGQGDYATKPEDFKRADDAYKEGKNIEVVELRTLTFT